MVWSASAKQRFELIELELNELIHCLTGNGYLLFYDNEDKEEEEEEEEERPIKVEVKQKMKNDETVASLKVSCVLCCWLSGLRL